MPYFRRVTGAMPDKPVMMMPPRRHFVRHMLRNATIAISVIVIGLLVGMTGYHWFGRLGWGESFYYASMILSGEGPPLDPPLAGQALMHLHIFAGFYALFSGVTFLTTVGVLFAPALHRFLHRFNLEIGARDEPPDQS